MNLPEILLLVALGAFGLAGGLDLTLGADGVRRRLVSAGAAIVGCIAVASAGGVILRRPAETVSLGTTLGVGRLLLRLDPLAGGFLLLTGGVGALVSLVVLGWSLPDGRVRGHGTFAGYALLLGATTIVFVAGDVFTLLFAWESLTASFYVLTGVSRRSHREVGAAWATVAAGKASGAALLIGLLLLAGRTGSFDLARFALVPPGPLHAAAWALLVVGFGIKVGLVPFQVWLPEGYPAAPGPFRAAMAGVAVNVGFYGLWRTFDLLGRPPTWLAVALLVAGGASALLGIAFVAVDGRLSRVIAWSSVENAGVIAVGYGVALAGAIAHSPRLVALGLLAASLVVIAHAVAKSLLFSAASVLVPERSPAAGRRGARVETVLDDALDDLGGLARRAPIAGGAFALGALSLAALPPTLGFVAEWMTLESLMQEFRLHSLALRLGMITAGALVALSAGLAAFAFARLIGVVLLGAPRDPEIGEEGRPGRLRVHPVASGALGLLGLAVVGLAAVAPWVVRAIAASLAELVPAESVRAALKSPWVLQPVFAGFSILSPSWFLVALVVGATAVALVAVALSKGRLLHPRRVPAWRSGADDPGTATRYSAFAYGNGVRHVLANVLGARREVIVSADRPRFSGVEGGLTPADGETAIVAPDRIEVRASVREPVTAYLVGPLRQAALAVSRTLQRLQSGRLEAYLAYMLAALVAVLLVVASLR